MGLVLHQDIKFTDYSRKVHRKLKAVMNTYAQLIEGTQVKTLHNKVKKWTGNLASSISITGSDFYKEIAPDTARVKYAQWIESGGRGGFMGYWYVKGSVDRYRNKFEQAIKDVTQERL